SLATSGIDVGFSFAQPLGGLGSLNLDAQGTWLNELRTEPLPGLESYDCKGKNGQTCGQPTPEWKHQARLTWSDTEQVGSISLNWRYIGSTTLDSTAPVFNSRIKAYSYFDLAATAKVQDGIVFRAGVNNLFDKDPPILALSALGNFNNGNTYPGVYDAVGRTVFVGLTAEF
ncbi:TonB-dependent receptor domain-containing protein, partial [Sphingomonas sp.]|uniref:TonB-dependent receptor domain-containing protein n=1 Tax=Sphingomonas sp. TaxID=28214 RepID=UPI0035AF0161